MPPEIAGGLEAAARECSPRVEAHRPGLVTVDVGGLDRLLGTPREIGVELQRACAARGLPASVAVAGTRTAAMLMAVAAPGLAVIEPGEERRRVSALPLGCLARLTPAGAGGGPPGHGYDVAVLLELLRRWGLKTLGDLARLPEAALSARVGQAGLAWQRVARGEDLEPLVAKAPEAPVEETLDLDWPVEGLEPLSFVLARVLEPIAQRLEQRDESAVILLMAFRLASRAIVSRRIELPAPMRDPKVLRTLVLLHLESHPLGEGVDRVTIRVEAAPAPVTQFSLLSRALPFPEQIATLVARLSALAGERAVGAPALVDSHRPGAFAMRPFDSALARLAQDKPFAPAGLPCPSPEPGGDPGRVEGRRREDGTPPLVVRRFRLPVAAHVLVKDGRPARVTTERRGLHGGTVEKAFGPWRTSGEWWRGDACGGQWAVGSGQPVMHAQRDTLDPPHTACCALPTVHRTPPHPFDRDEWDVALADGAAYRVFKDRATERWFVDGIID